MSPEPPLPGSDGSDSISIKLIQELQVGHEKTSQVFVVRCMNSSSSPHIPNDQDMVAKFYDPLYDDFEEYPFFGTDYQYTHECAAYMHLSALHGVVIPRFFGSYTLRINIGERFRLVRLILIERVDGPSMDSLKPETFPREERQEIMKQIVAGESSIYAKDVRHLNLRPRNVVVKRHNSGKLRIVIIDLGMSVIGRSRFPSDSREENRYFPGVAISPLLRWNAFYGHQGFFPEWINWPWQAWLEVQYKDTEDTITSEQRERYKIYDWMLDNNRRPPPI
ncbi:hypothetical protein BO94DRAFT_535367 [Aspergillus sclerotioniger CBS 115572]|uniref:Protein kinase domain-containing protein n=1 Tax=Aspergillus sclerotioniger CBS 115572 TaxID=1450535 RepID=A0A317WLI2_9EURO|nr:hypothetical protein BO94DRAFT_535367 [Aspergillus sclerotioniger CBS 115572]PWY87253.1 hypothetical protein BO94DRAFT_535367 [Aspergillus sclerotioniger CBS 115572]